MKNKTLLLASVMLGMSLGTVCGQQTEPSSLEQRFYAPPADTRIAVYWYWMNDNVSVDAVVADLKAMKEKGITRAFIGNIGESGIPRGSVRILSDEWWEALRAALRTAAELDIEIGIFNSPGWSQSGGPWIAPQQAMRYIASSTVRVRGGQHISLKLPADAEALSTVRVLAFPVPREDRKFVQTSSDACSVTLQSDKPTTVRSVKLIPKQEPFATRVRVKARQGKRWTELKEMAVDRSNAALNVGFDPWAPIVISLPPTKTDELVVEWSGEAASRIESVEVSGQALVESYAEKSLGKMFPAPLPMWDHYLWPEQPAAADGSGAIGAGEVRDLTPLVTPDGILEWEAPRGEWTVMHCYAKATGVTNTPATPEGTGLEVDKMSREHVAYHFDHFIGEILRRVPAEERRTFRVVVEDSYEVGSQNWTDNLLQAFADVYGYDPVPYLPALQGIVVGTPDRSDRFLWDYRKLVADKVAQDYVGGLREVSNRNGLTTWLENYGHWGFPGEFLQYGGQSDEIAGEFWSEGSLGDIENRAASSCGHIYGKPCIWAESNTCGGPEFSRYPLHFKQRGDRFFTEGINATLLHLSILQADSAQRMPGLNAWFGNEFNRNNTWFAQMDSYITYLKRCNLMLQQGQYVADVAYFIGEDTPKMTGECRPSLPEGYAFDYVNADVLLNRAHVENGRLLLEGGMSYRVLVLPQQTTIRPQLLECIAQFVRQGLTVIGPRPERSPSLAGYPESDRTVKRLAEALWGSGRVRDTPDLRAVLDSIGAVPDCQPHSADTPWLFIHRRLEADGHVYFISNQSDQPTHDVLTLRTTGCTGTPQWWDPVSGTCRWLPDYTRDEAGNLTLPLSLDGLESAFIVVRNGYTEALPHTEGNDLKQRVLASLDTDWQVSFESPLGEAFGPLSFATLTDWSTDSCEQVRHFSGTATYTKTFTLTDVPADESLYLNLGDLVAMGRVWVNGRLAGSVWTRPYRVEVTGLLNQGENEIRIEVVNTWVNRLIGDAALPSGERKTWLSTSTWRADSPLQRSGLFGPVTLTAGRSFRVASGPVSAGE